MRYVRGLKRRWSGMKKMAGYEPLIVKDSEILLLDQRKLPNKIEYFSAKSVEDVCFAIKEMVVRGAPFIGITAAFGYYLAVKDSDTNKQLKVKAKKGFECLLQTRPTAVNLFFALNKMNDVMQEKCDILPTHKLINKLRAAAFTLWENQKKEDLAIGKIGADYLKNKRRILTHCNTGTLATGGIGTALGIIKTMHKKGCLDLVYVDETRPYLQGARLTAFELELENIEYRIVTDNSCGMLMKKGLIDAVIVGADRIAKNGDTANKIGTYCLAVTAKRHNIDFIVAAPESTIDRNIETQNEIIVEERNAKEVLEFNSIKVAPKNAKAVNYSFDITDNELIDAIITEKQVYERFEF